MAVKVWDERYYVIDKQYWGGTAGLHGTLDNSAAADAGGGLTRLAITGHGMLVGNQIIIAGTTNYDGIHTIQAVAANTIDITATFVAETPAGTETYKTCFRPPPSRPDYQVMEARLTLSAAGGAVEDYTITLDSQKGAGWDCTLETAAMNALAFVDTVWGINERRFFHPDDVLLFQYANTNSRTWGLELIYRRHA
jgi:hypothetical protein